VQIFDEEKRSNKLSDLQVDANRVKSDKTARLPVPIFT
jgi:hypothetical protein